MRVGVLAAQGAFIEHIAIMNRLDIEAVPVRLPRELDKLDGLIIPGGESTTISRLMLAYNLFEPVRSLAQNGLPVFGTCAGMIMLASDVADGNGVKPLALMQVKIKRNAFGRQRESFETELAVPALGDKPFPAVFIRSPYIEQTGEGVQVLARLDPGKIVAVRQGKMLATAFHPELTDDTRFHGYFRRIITGGE